MLVRIQPIAKISVLEVCTTKMVTNTFVMVWQMPLNANAPVSALQVNAEGPQNFVVQIVWIKETPHVLHLVRRWSVVTSQLGDVGKESAARIQTVLHHHLRFVHPGMESVATVLPA